MRVNVGRQAGFPRQSKREEEREFYLCLACAEKWSSREPERRIINGELFERIIMSGAKVSQATCSFVALRTGLCQELFFHQHP